MAVATKSEKTIYLLSQKANLGLFSLARNDVIINFSEVPII